MERAWLKSRMKAGPLVHRTYASPPPYDGTRGARVQGPMCRIPIPGPQYLLHEHTSILKSMHNPRLNDN